MQNLQKEMERVIASTELGTRLLLHTCCAPCAASALPRLCEHFEVSIFYYNPNIASYEEHEKRYEQLVTLTKCLPLKIAPQLIKEPFAQQDFLQAVQGMQDAPEGGVRCDACFRVRLERTAQFAAGQNIGWAATTLSASPHKNAALLWRMGNELADKYSVKCLPCDFKKKNGVLQSIQLCKQHDIYRQSYCGCSFSHSENTPTSDFN